MADIVVRLMAPADQERLLNKIKNILSETGANKAPIFSQELWEWQCLSPEFEAFITIAEDGPEIVGWYHLVSRAMRIDGQPRVMVLLQDLGVLPEYRRHGLFNRIAQVSMDECTRRVWDITYSFPNHRSFPGLIKHQGYTYIGNAPLRVRPLTPGEMLAARLPVKGLWRLIGRAGMAVYNVLFPLHRPAGLQVEEVTHFGQEVDAVSNDFLGKVRLGCLRSAAFLNWRYLAKPTHEYRAWGARRDGQLNAFLITRRATMFGADCMVIMDLGCRDGAEADLLALIAARLRAEREAGASLAVTMGTHPFFSQLGRLGYLRIPDRINPRPLRFTARAHTDRVGDEIKVMSNWLTTPGDWDVL